MVSETTQPFFSKQIGILCCQRCAERTYYSVKKCLSFIFSWNCTACYEWNQRLMQKQGLEAAPTTSGMTRENVIQNGVKGTIRLTRVHILPRIHTSYQEYTLIPKNTHISPRTSKNTHKGNDYKAMWNGGLAPNQSTTNPFMWFLPRHPKNLEDFFFRFWSN